MDIPASLSVLGFRFSAAGPSTTPIVVLAVSVIGFHAGVDPSYGYVAKPILGIERSVVAFSVTATIEAPEQPWNMAQAAQDLASLFRNGCLGNASIALQGQILHCLNTAQQQVFSSSRIAEFLVKPRVTQYPPEFNDVAINGDGLFYVGDTYRYSGAWYLCTQAYNYASDNTLPSDPAFWTKVFEKDSDLFTKGIPLPTIGRTINPSSADREVQHVMGVQYADQRVSVKKSYSLAPVHQSPLGALRITHTDAEPGGTRDWYDDTTLPTDEITLNCSTPGDSYTPLGFFLQPSFAVDVVPGMWVYGTHITTGCRVAAVLPNGIIKLSASTTIYPLSAESISFAPNIPPMMYEVFRDPKNQSRLTIRCFPSAGLDTDSYIFVLWCPAARRITWDDVENGSSFDLAPLYVELYLMPLARLMALQSNYFPVEEIPVRSPAIEARYKEVLGILGIADFQPKAVVK